VQSPLLIDVMQKNLDEIRFDQHYRTLFQAAAHTGAFLDRQQPKNEAFVDGLRQALAADWAHPKWKSANEIETIFRPLKQQFIYALMRFNCT
jgi:hypothetical protein